MEPNPHYRYIRSLGCGASLFSVTEPGIDEFLAAPDAGQPGIVVLALDGEAGAAPAVRFIGGPRVGEVLRHLQDSEGPALGIARPLAVMAVEAEPGLGWIGMAVAERMRRRAEAIRECRSPEPGGDLGRWESLVESLPGAVAHVIGYDPFEPRRALN